MSIKTITPPLSSIPVAKLTRWAYFICEPSVPEFVDAICHFFPRKRAKLCVFFDYDRNPISQEKGSKDSFPLTLNLLGIVGSFVWDTKQSTRKTDESPARLADGRCQESEGMRPFGNAILTNQVLSFSLRIIVANPAFLCVDHVPLLLLKQDQDYHKLKMGHSMKLV
jgi:hypothetical protein